VRYGMQLPVQSQSTYYAERWEASAGRDELAAIARACDAAGFDDVEVFDEFDLGSIFVAFLGACALLLVLEAIGGRSSARHSDDR